MTESRTGWTNASVVDFAGGTDPVEKMEEKTREVVLEAVDQGWGPPFDLMELANVRGIPVRPNTTLADARVLRTRDGYKIKCNPYRTRGRVNFSIAHDSAHTFFADCAEEVRNRSREGWEPNRELEVLCNFGAAELTMTVGSFPSNDAVETIEELMQIRKRLNVSAEAVLIRHVHLSVEPVTHKERFEAS